MQDDKNGEKQEAAVSAEGESPPVIVTAKVRKCGERMKRFVQPSRTVFADRIDSQTLAAYLRANVRVVLYRDRFDNPICDFYNVLTMDGKGLKPCCRMLRPFVDVCHKEAKVKIALKHNRTVISQESYDRMCSEVKRRRAVVPRRHIRVKCERCGYVNDVTLGGFGENEE